MKIAETEEFINYVEKKNIAGKVVACDYAKLHNLFGKLVCTKTLYQYINLRLTKIKNIDLKR